MSRFLWFTVYCGQTAGWINMPFGTEVGFGPDHIVLDAAPHFYGFRTINRGPCLLWPNGGMGQDSTCYGGRPNPRRHCVTWGPDPPPTERGTAAPQLFGACLGLLCRVRAFLRRSYNYYITYHRVFVARTQAGLGP